jgi:hypothetical protein
VGALPGNYGAAGPYDTRYTDFSHNFGVAPDCVAALVWEHLYHGLQSLILVGNSGCASGTDAPDSTSGYFVMFFVLSRFPSFSSLIVLIC